ncbi:MAG: hypothetical protein M1833_003630 [Piccolia ochrophora]|nr:MAG: hypothetical protein M1833_003630 [Piccolia ochrophora]
MSTLRNAVQRRTHRERGQPQERSKWGLLEKPKDYRLRARDYAAKKSRLRALRQKASERNPDEFYFGMMRSSMGKDGQKVGKKNNQVLSHDVTRLLKTQDAGYLRTMGTKARKELERLRGTFILGPTEGVAEVPGEEHDERSPGHLVFVDNEKEQKGFRPRAWVDKDEQAQNPSHARPKDTNHDPTPSDSEEQEAPDDRRASRRRERMATRLRALSERRRQIETAEREADMQRARMAKSSRVGGTNKRGVNWKAKGRQK